jgi:hypothetical protein
MGKRDYFSSPNSIVELIEWPFCLVIWHPYGTADKHQIIRSTHNKLSYPTQHARPYIKSVAAANHSQNIFFRSKIVAGLNLVDKNPHTSAIPVQRVQLFISLH